jgi:hypothetical protein
MDQPLTSKSSRMVLRGTVCAASGVVLTVLVAWMFAILPPPTTPITMVPTGGNQSALEIVGRPVTRPFRSPPGLWGHPRAAKSDGQSSDGFDAHGRGMFEVKRFGVRIRHQTEWWDQGELIQTITQYSYGWPALALERWTTYWLDRTPAEQVEAKQRLPGRVRSFGFAINAAFYSALLFVLWSAPASLRSRFRTRRGLCTHCGYDLRGLTGRCPECGSERSRPRHGN